MKIHGGGLAASPRVRRSREGDAKATFVYVALGEDRKSRALCFNPENP